MPERTPGRARPRVRATLVCGALALLACPGSTRTPAVDPGVPAVDPGDPARVEVAPPAATASAPSASPSEALVEAAPEPIPPAPPTTLLEAEADFDGAPGNERITLKSDGALVVGDARGHVVLTGASQFWLDTQASITVEVLDRAKRLRAVVVTLPTAESEDPPNRYQVFIQRDAALVSIFDAVLGVYGVTPLTFRGDGTVRYVEDGWTACQRAGDSKQAVREEVIFTRADDGSLSTSRRRPTRQKQACDALAACPMVYVGDAAQPVGEILRGLLGPAAYDLQSLSIPLPGAETVRVRIVEEKAEVSHVDEVYLVVDGQRVAPSACSRGAPPAFCAADRRMTTIELGDSIELEFSIPATARAGLLFARGHYEPRPTPAR